ncbi:FlgO family outer membrane protein [Thalassotalea euphylliae]|uniref:FlgO family outer membrane protein n=1 Tax=Thalassotalea euphylliae TaxID=1655234 RepID=UPI003637884E
MKKWLMWAALPLLTACSMTMSDDEQDFYSITHEEKGEIDTYDLPTHAINDVVKGLAYQMLEHSAFVTPKTPIAVTSFVNLEDLESTNWLGNQIAENFVHELQRHGMVIIDYKTTGHIRVTETGDFVFSRDWKELPERQIIDYVVTGTMMKQETGILVNARMIGMQSRVVVASAQSFIPKWVVGDEINRDESVRMKDGMILRNSEQLAENARAVRIQQ